ncbi:MAG: S8 family serine peptidase [Thermoplasmatota archaeon]
MRTSAEKVAPLIVLVLLTVSFSPRSTTAGTDLGSEILTTDPDTVEPYDWTGWDMDTDSDRIDDRLETGIPDYEIIDGRVGINVHIDGTPDPEDIEMIMDLLERIGADPDFIRIGKFSTAVYLTVDHEIPGQINSLTLPDRINMIELRPVMRNFLDVSAPAITARESQRYSPFTAEDLGYTGEGITIAVIDSGVDNSIHESLQGKYVYGVDFTGVTIVYGLDPNDADGHGTHCAGVAMGTGGQSERYKGVAPGADLVDLRYSRIMGDVTGNADNALEWIIENHVEYGISVVSCSWGSTSISSGRDTTSRLVDQVVDEGVVVVVAAGNDGISGLPSPAAADGAITVGAFGDSNTIDRGDDAYQSFSNYGPRSSDGDNDVLDELKPDILAPGTNIISAQHDSVMNYVSMTGTSMSCPHVSGVVALMLEANPYLSPEQVKDILRDTAYQRRDPSRDDLDGKYNYRSGWGDVDSYGAVKRAEDLLSFRVEAPNQVRLAQAVNVNVTGHLTKTEYDTDDDFLTLELHTPYGWGKPENIKFDPGAPGVGYSVIGPFKGGDNWVVAVDARYNDSMQESDPVLSAEITPIGNIGDEETIDGWLWINSMMGFVENRDVTISFEAEPPDVSIIPSSILFSDSLPQGGDEITITVKVNNTGGSDARDCLVRIIDGPERTGRTIGEERITVPYRDHAMAEFQWITSAGIHTITAIADPDNEIFESVEDNNSAERPITVRGINPPPIADLTVTPGDGSTLTQFLFDGSGSDDTNLVGGNVVSYNFDYGDGEVSGWIDSPTAVHRYSEPGSYTASLVVMDNGGAESSNQAVQEINVTAMSSDGVTLFLEESGMMTRNGSDPFIMDIPEGNEVDMLGMWTSEEMDRTRTLLYPAVFRAETISERAAEIHIEAVMTAGEEVSTTSRTFQIPGNNETSVLSLELLDEEAVVGYMESITLRIGAYSNTSGAVIAGGSGGSSLMYSSYLTPNSVPIVDAGPDREVKAGQTLTFSGDAEDADGNIEYLRWDVNGDGEWDSEGSDAYSFDYQGYPSEGIYTAVLEARDDFGYWGRDSARITVRPSDYNYPPTVEIECENGTVANGLMTVRGTAEDDIGIDRVDVRIEDESGYAVVDWTAAKGREEWSYVWDTTRELPGEYDFMARSFDGDRYSETKYCLMVIDNPFNRPRIISAGVEPDPLLNDGETPLVITALIEDPDLPDDRLFVEADLSGLGGPEDVPLVDNGIGDDESAGDGEYTGSYTPPGLILVNSAVITITATDSFGETAQETVTISIVSSISVSVESVREINTGSELLLEVSVEPPSSDLIVIADPDGTIVPGGIQLNDEGEDGDRLSGDGTYSGRMEITVDPGDYELEIIVASESGETIWSGTEKITVLSVSSEETNTIFTSAFLVTVLIVMLILAAASAVIVFLLSRKKTVSVGPDGTPYHFGISDHIPTGTPDTEVYDSGAIPQETVVANVLETMPSA